MSKKQDQLNTCNDNDSSCYRHPASDLATVVHEVLRDHPDESFCFLNEGKLRANMATIREHFLPEDTRRRIIYAIKANSHPCILEVLADEGVDGFDCASPQEIDKVQSFKSDVTILYNNPIKTTKDRQAALEKGVRFFTEDCHEAIRDILEIEESESALEIAVRVEMSNQHAGVNLSSNNKFGAPPEEVIKMLRLLKSHKVPTGLYVHAGSQNTNPGIYQEIIELMATIGESVGGVDSLNIAAGIPIDYEKGGELDKTEYLNALHQAIRSHIAKILDPNSKDPKIMIELGRSIVGDAIDLAVPVTRTKEVEGKKYVYINDGIFTSFSDAVIHDWRYPFRAITRKGQILSGTQEPYTVFGRSCDSGDEIPYEVMLPSDLKREDYIWVPNAGAYMDSQASCFNEFPLPTYISYNSTQRKKRKNNNAKTLTPQPELAKQNRFTSEVLTPPEITPETIREVADFFRLMFNNDWPEWVVCPPCDSSKPDGMKLSAREVYGAHDETIPLEVLDTMPKIPDCPCCGNKMQIFHNRDKTLERMQERLTGNGYVSLLRDSTTNQIEGLAYGYKTTLKEQFESEWSNRYVYMAEQNPKHNRSFQQFLECLKKVFPNENFEPNTEVFCWNCVAISQKARGKKNLRTLINNFLDSIPPEDFALWNIGEVEKGSRWLKILKKGGVKEVPGFLEGNETITGVIFQDSANAFRMPPDEFAK